MTSSSTDAAGAGRPGPGAALRRRDRLLAFGLPAFLAVVVLACAAWFAFHYLPTTRAETVETVKADLQLRLRSRGEAIGAWVREGAQDGQVVADFPSTRAILATPHSAAQVSTHLGPLLADLARVEGIGSIFVCDPAGRLLSGSTDEPADAAYVALARNHLGTGGPVTEFVRDAHGVAHVLVVVPVRSTPGVAPQGAVVTVRDPRDWLYPYLTPPPMIYPSSITFLVQRDGDSLTVLSPARFNAAPPMSLVVEARPQLPASIAVEGKVGFVETTDFRGVRVLAASTPIAGTRWSLVVKVDRSEALSWWRHRMWASGITLGGFLVMTLLLGTLLWRGQQKERLAAVTRDRAHLATLLDQANDPILFVNLDGTIRAANRRAETFYGVPASGLEGRSAFQLRPPDQVAAAAAWHQEMLRREEAVFRTTHVAAGGLLVPVEIGTRRVRSGDDDVFVSVVRDIGERQRTEDHVLRLNRMLRTLSEINQLMLRGQSAEQVLLEACEIAVEHGGFQLAWVAVPAQDGTVEIVASAGKAGYLDGITTRWDDTPEGRGPTGTALREHRTVITDDTETDPTFVPWRERARVHGLRCSAASPIRRDGEVVGALNLYADTPAYFEAETTRLLEELAGDIGFALRAIEERAALQETEARLAAFFHSPAIGMLIGSVHGAVHDANDEFLRIVGYSREHLEAGRLRWDEITPPEFLPLDAQRIDEAVEHGVCTPYEKQYLRKDGSRVWVLVGFALIGNSRDTSVAYILDISPHKRAEAARHESEQRFRLLVEGAPIGIIIHTGGTIQYLNGTACRLFGTTDPGALIGTALLDRVHPDYRGMVIARVAAMRERDRNASPLEERLLRVDGGEFMAEVEAVPVMHEDEPGAMVFFRDVTAHNRALEEQALVSAALEQSADVAIITDTVGTILYVNPAFERITGWSRAEAVGRNPRILKSGRQDPAFYARMWAMLTTGQVFTSTVTNRRKDGESYVAEVVISPIRDASGRITRYLGLQRDITREHLLEEQLRQSQKMEAVGRLTGGIAHDFNNLLGVVLANAASLRRDLPPERGDLVDPVDDIIEAATNGGAMVRKLLAFSRRERLAPVTLDLTKELADIARTLQRFLPETITIERHVAGALPAVVDAAALEQIMLNLATNARDAMSGGGTLTIRGHEVELASDGGEVAADGKPGRFVCVEVTDTGHGMDEETLSHVFEPFFTTKPAGAGTGLGLAMVFGLVRQLGGFVRIMSVPGHGTTVQLHFRAGQAARVSDPARGPAHPREHPASGRILVVEDQEQLRRATARALSRLGYEVLVAEGGAEALRILEEATSHVSLVLSDLVMPGMSGVELHGRLRARGIAIPFLLMSGYTAGSGEAQQIPDDMELIMKPWTLEAMSAHIRRLLSGHDAAS